MSTLPEYAELKAKFQVYDGVGPTDMIAVVSPAADENAFTGNRAARGHSAMLDQSNSRCEIGAKCNGSHNGDNEK